MVEKEVKMQFFTASIVMKGESYCCRHTVASFVACKSLMFCLCLCRGDGTEPFRVGARKGEVELNKYKKTLIRETSNKGLLLFN